jgi:exonuclease III
MDKFDELNEKKRLKFLKKTIRNKKAINENTKFIIMGDWNNTINENNVKDFMKKEEINVIDAVTQAKKPFYYHIENEKGVILDYYLITAEEQEVVKFEFRFYKKGQKLMAHYNGYTASYTF